MGLSKSKAGKPGQPGFANQQGFSSGPQMSNQQPFSAGQMPGAGGFPGQSAFGTTTPGFGTATNFGQPQGPQGFGPQPGGFSSGFPPFPPQPAQQQLGFPPSSLFPNGLAPPPPMGPPSAYPVSYQNQSNQPFRPLIPGYAPAPGNDRRGGQDHHHHHQQEQGEFSNRFFNDQMHPMPPMGQMHKSRKH